MEARTIGKRGSDIDNTDHGGRRIQAERGGYGGGCPPLHRAKRIVMNPAKDGTVRIEPAEGHAPSSPGRRGR